MGRVLVACEESQVVTIEFRKLGHEAYSCDIIEPSGGHPEWHIQDDVLNHLDDGWDMMIGFPPCTYISYAGTRHWNNPGRLEKRLDALRFFAALWSASIDKICLENPRGCASPTIAKYSQKIQPYYFGDSYSKSTCLWLKNLPKLIHNQTESLFWEQTHVDRGEFREWITRDGKLKREAKWYTEDKNPKNRSKTFPGIARAFATQYGGYIETKT